MGIKTLALLLCLALTAQGATITGDLRDTGRTVRPRAKVTFTPSDTPYASGTVTILSVTRSTYATNGLFSIALEAGDYSVTVDTGDNFSITVPDDTNTLTFNYVASLAGSMVTLTPWTNTFMPPSFLLRGGSNVTVTTNNAGLASEYLTISSTVSGGGGGTPLRAGTNTTLATVFGTNVVSADVGLSAIAGLASTGALTLAVAPLVTTGHLAAAISTGTVAVAQSLQGTGSNLLQVVDTNTWVVKFWVDTNGATWGNFAGGTNLPLSGIAGANNLTNWATLSTNILNEVKGAGGMATNVWDLDLASAVTNCALPVWTNSAASNSVMTLSILWSGKTTNDSGGGRLEWQIVRSNGVDVVTTTNDFLKSAVGTGDVTEAQLISSTNIIFAAGTNAAKSYTDAREVAGTNSAKGFTEAYTLASTNASQQAATNAAKSYTDARESAGTNSAKSFTEAYVLASTNTAFLAATNAANTRTTDATNGLWSAADSRVTGATNGAVSAATNSAKLFTESLVILSTNQGALSFTLPDRGTKWQTFSTNASFALADPANVSTYATNVQQVVTVITNTSGSTITFTTPATWLISGGTTQYLTNQGVLTVMVYPLLGTNAAWKCLK